MNVGANPNSVLVLFSNVLDHHTAIKDIADALINAKNKATTLLLIFQYRLINAFIGYLNKLCLLIYCLSYTKVVSTRLATYSILLTESHIKKAAGC